MSKIVFKVPPKVAAMAARVGVRVAKRSPEILLGVGIVGGVTATVLACKATLHLEEVLDKHNQTMEKIAEVASDKEAYPDYTDEKVVKDKYIQTVKTVVAIGKLYAPAVIIGGLSIASLLGGHHIMLKRQAALSALYAATKKAYDEYRKRVREEIGDEREHELYLGVREQLEEVEKNGKVKQVKKKVLDNPYPYSPYARFFDEGSRWWKKDAEMNKTFLINQQIAANELLKLQGHLFLNEVYDMLDIPRTEAGQLVGWVYGHGDSAVSFGFCDPDNPSFRDFVNCRERVFLLDFNVDGVIYDMLSIPEVHDYNR